MDPGARPAINQRLIVDIGMSEGNDTQFYLDKGFTVFGVEADPVMFTHLQARFAEAISQKRLQVVNRIASADHDTMIEFWRNEVDQGLSSSVRSDNPAYAATQRKVDVKSINWPGTMQTAGVPYYCKIDIEGAEAAFLGSMIGTRTQPTYISVEAHTIAPIEQLHALGYRRFKLIDQNILHTFPIPDPPLEGRLVTNPSWDHASGPFGREVPGRWLDYTETVSLFQQLLGLRAYRTVHWTWLDCHAWRPTDTADQIFCVLDQADRSGIAGWAVHPNQPNRAPELTAYIDGIPAGTFACTSFRPDVKASGQPTDRAGFSHRFAAGSALATGRHLDMRDRFGNPVDLHGLGLGQTSLRLR